MRNLLIALALTAGAASFAQLKPPPSQRDDAVKFHQKNLGTSAAVRAKGYEDRLRMEAASPFSQLAWRNVGPEIQGGRVIRFDAPIAAPNKLYVAYASGGLWRSTNMSTTWESVFDGPAAYSIGDFALSKNGKTIWVGTGENNSQRTSYSGHGVYKSTDEGKTWQHMGLVETHRIGRVLINPKNENTVYVGAIGGLYSQDTNRGVYKTTDGGSSWTQVLKLDEYTGVIDMVMDPRNPDVIYASAWDRDRRAWNFRDGGPGTGIYKTTDGGKNWTKLTMGLPNDGNTGRIGLALAPTKPDRVYAFVDNQGGDTDSLYADEWVRSGTLTTKRFRLISDVAVFRAIDPKILTPFVERYMPTGSKVEDVLKLSLDEVAAKMEEKNKYVWVMPVADGEIYRTDDAGKSWKRVNIATLPISGYGYYCGRITVNPHNADEVFVTSAAMFKSKDGGRSWQNTARGMHSDYHDYWISPHDANFHAVGQDGGFALSHDDGATWENVNKMAVGQFTTLALDNKIPYNIYGGLQDNGTMKGPSNYNPGRSDFWLWDSIGGGDGSAIAVDPRPDSEVVFGSSQWGSFYGIDQKTRQRWSFGGRPSFAGMTNCRWQWIAPIFISPHVPDITYVGSQYVHRSLNQGRTWKTISPDLTKNKPVGDVPFATIKELAESPQDFGTIYAGTDDGNLWITKNHGDTWTPINTPADKWVCRIVPSKYDSGTVYVAQTGYREDDFTAYLYKSTDNGRSWTSIVGNLPAEPLNVVREDPENREWLYVGTDRGVFFTKDGGKNWIPLNGGIPRAPVHDLQIQAREKEMVIGTHSRSVWIFKLADLYRLTDEITSKDFYLWPVANMSRADLEYRRRPNYDPTDGVPPEVSGELWTKEPGPGFIRIKDKSGKVVKEKAVDWARGYNRFSLDLLLEGGKRFSTDPRGTKPKTAEEAVKDPYEAWRPLFVPAGEYTLEFVIGSKTQSAAWKLG